MTGRLYSCREAAKLLDLSDDSVRRMIHAGQLDGVRIGKRILRVLGESLDRCIHAGSEPRRLVCHGEATCVVRVATAEQSAPVITPAGSDDACAAIQPVVGGVS